MKRYSRKISININIIIIKLTFYIVSDIFNINKSKIFKQLKIAVKVLTLWKNNIYIFSILFIVSLVNVKVTAKYRCNNPRYVLYNTDPGSAR